MIFEQNLHTRLTMLAAKFVLKFQE
jgi:hypothetical protein